MNIGSTGIDLFGIAHVEVEFILAVKIYTIPILSRNNCLKYKYCTMWAEHRAVLFTNFEFRNWTFIECSNVDCIWVRTLLQWYFYFKTWRYVIRKSPRLKSQILKAYTRMSRFWSTNQIYFEIRIIRFFFYRTPISTEE